MNNWFLWLIILMGVVGPLFYLAGTVWKLLLSWRTPTTWIRRCQTRAGSRWLEGPEGKQLKAR